MNKLCGVTNKKQATGVISTNDVTFSRPAVKIISVE